MINIPTCDKNRRHECTLYLRLIKIHGDESSNVACWGKSRLKVKKEKKEKGVSYFHRNVADKSRPNNRTYLVNI